MMTKTNGNSFDEDFQEKLDYPTTEERILMHEAICKRLGENVTPESYVEICREYCIEAPIMPPAYGWKP